MITSINHARLGLLAIAALLLAACATQPVPLQGEFNPITPREATDHDSTGAMVRGIQTSALPVTPANPSGMMPITVSATSLIRMLRPTSAGSVL